MRSGGKRLGALLAAAIMAVGTLVLAGPAAARTGDRGTVTARPATAARAADTITCKLKIGHPHYSHHADAGNRHRVNVVATTGCDHKVASLSLKVRLYKNGKPYKTTGWKTRHATTHLKQNAARRCVKNQKYTGRAWLRVVFPPRYEPNRQSKRVTSKTVTIRKCRRS